MFILSPPMQDLEADLLQKLFWASLCGNFLLNNSFFSF